MTEEARDFHASTDQMLEMLEHLREIEQRKQDATLGSEQLAALAKEAQQVSRLVFRWSGLQEDAALASVRAVRNGATPVRISDARPQPVHRILADWREAQLRLEIAQPGSPEAESAANDIERLREAFHVAHEANRARHA
jgi:hypothetical protein